MSLVLPLQKENELLAVEDDDEDDDDDDDDGEEISDNADADTVLSFFSLLLLGPILNHLNTRSPQKSGISFFFGSGLINLRIPSGSLQG